MLGVVKQRDVLEELAEQHLSTPRAKLGQRRDGAVVILEGMVLQDVLSVRTHGDVRKEVAAPEGARPGAQVSTRTPISRRSAREVAGTKAGQNEISLTLRHRLALEVERLSEEEAYVLEKLCERESALGELRRLAQNFLCLFRKGHADGLNNWFQAAAKSDLKDLQAFAWSLLREQDALAASIKLPWSNGPTKGVVTKIKLVKRQMYGRGSFELLRKRVLLAA